MCDAGAADCIIDSMINEQNLIKANGYFAAIAVLRGKSYDLHDARSATLSDNQLRILEETVLSINRSLSKEIDELQKGLLTYCRSSSETCSEFDVDAVGDADCRAALEVAVNLACRFRTRFEAENTLRSYNVMQIVASTKHWQGMDKAVTELESHAAGITADNLRLREELRTVKAQNEALKERVRVCSDRLGKDRRLQPPSKKQLDPAAELERSIESALTQFDVTKKKCDALTRELNDAKRALEIAEQELSDVAKLKDRLREASEDCSAKDDQIEALNSKLRCSICEERDKDTAFACGHTLCGECATACAKCPLRCESERRHKPVKHTFRLYL